MGRSWGSWHSCVLGALLLSGLFASRANSAADGDGVVLLRVPESGVQPRAVIDSRGVVHLVYLRGDPSASDIRYARLDPGSGRFSVPVTVNSNPGSAIARGTIRGAQLALGQGGRVHVVWNGNASATPPNPSGGAPLLHARSNQAGTAFEPQRNLMTRTTDLDGGCALASDGQGRVLVAWHARDPRDPRGEVNRRLHASRSDDDGATFPPEVPALDSPTGACPCCGTQALATPSGAFAVLFRGASTALDRDMLLARSVDGGASFAVGRVHEWKVNMCPMSSESLANGPDGLLAAWETQGQIYVARVDIATGRTSVPVHPRGSGGNRKHPALAVNARGDYIVAWAEDTSFTRGGSLAWRIFDRSGKATELAGRVENGIPHMSLPTAVARPDGTFLIIH